MSKTSVISHAQLISCHGASQEWNHDLGGFMQGEGTSMGPYDPHIGKHTWLHNPERYARWLQAGVFQGIFRTHQSAPGDPTPWRYPTFEVLRAAMQVRGLSSPGLS